MSKLSISTILAALCGSALLTACPGDDTTGTGTETESSSSSSTGPVITTVPTTMTMTTDDTTTTMVETTVAVDDTSTGTTTTGESTTTTGESTTTTTGESTTTTGESTTTTGESTESSSTGEPPPPMDGYGDCSNYDDAAACLPEELCINAPLGAAVCLEVGCMDATDCIVPATGTAVPTCVDLVGDVMNECYLDCSMGEACPDGMSCVLDFVCVWDMLPGVCPDQDLGNTVPQSLMDDNGGLGNDHDSSCGDGGGADAMYMFTAPAAATYTFSTEGSAIDTILSVLDDCGGMELDCNDDTVMLTSEVTIDLAAGQMVVIVVEGYGGEEGAITLSIS